MRLRRKSLTAAAALVAAVAIAACGSSSSGGSTGSGSSSSNSALVGAGSTLVQPLVQVWQPLYLKSSNVAVTYGGIGSGGGIEQIAARTVDFGASDAPMTSAQASACKGCVEIPWALGAVDVAYNVKGVPNGLHFTGPVLAKIWMGQITKWNDPAIQALNPGVKLPSTTIVPVHRTDGSGDTFAFTNYLSKISPAFKSKIGNATTVNWPGGIGGKGNSGVGAGLATNGSIAYIAIAYVLANHFHYALIQNPAGKYPTPGIPSIEAAAAEQKSIPQGGTQGVSITDQPGADSYPVATFTYIIIPKSSPKAAGLKTFVNWAITTGQQSAPSLDFAPLPSGVVSADKATLNLIK